MLKLTRRVIRLPREKGSAFINLMVIPSKPATFLLSSSFIIETTVELQVSERWNADDASEQNDTGENDGSGRASASLSAIDRKWQFKSSGVKSES